MNYRISTDYIQIQLNNTIMCTTQRAGKSQGTGFVKHMQGISMHRENAAKQYSLTYFDK